MADPIQKKTQPADSATSASGVGSISLGDLEAMFAKLGDAIGAGVVKALAAEREAQKPGNRAKPPKAEIPEEFKGPRTYFVGPKGAFQGNRRFVQGERITIVDQFPSKDWTPVESAVETPAKPAQAKSGRASDQTVG